jgi:hypothetical protein
MKSMVFLLLAGAASATAAPLQVSCVPSHKPIQTLRVGWDELRDIVSFELSGTMTAPPTVQLKTVLHRGFDGSVTASTNDFQFAPGSQTSLVHAEGGSSDVAFDGATFVMTDLQSPPSAGPVAPGDWPAYGTLVLTASHREGPGKPLVVETRSIDLSCRYVFSIPR